MNKPGRGIARVVRSGAAAACTTALAVLGHVLGGGTVHAGLALLVLLWVAVAAYAVAARRLSFPRLLALVGAGQVAFHGVFTLTHPAAGHGVPSESLAAGSLTGGLLPGLAEPTMLTGHLLAAVATAALLARGDAALWLLARLLDRTVVAVRLAQGSLPSAPRRMRARPVSDHFAGMHGDLLTTAQPHRGPPAALAV